jgi:hypothetical protein
MVMMISITMTLKCDNNFRFPKSCYKTYSTYLGCTMTISEPIKNDILMIFFPRVETYFSVGYYLCQCLPSKCLFK